MKLSGSPPKNAICCFGREDQADVGVLLVAVEPVLAALIERDDVGAEAGLLQALPFDRGDLRFALGELLRPASWRP